MMDHQVLTNYQLHPVTIPSTGEIITLPEQLGITRGRTKSLLDALWRVKAEYQGDPRNKAADSNAMVAEYVTKLSSEAESLEELMYLGIAIGSDLGTTDQGEDEADNHL